MDKNNINSVAKNISNLLYYVKLIKLCKYKINVLKSVIMLCQIY